LQKSEWTPAKFLSCFVQVFFWARNISLIKKFPSTHTLITLMADSFAIPSFIFKQLNQCWSFKCAHNKFINFLQIFYWRHNFNNTMQAKQCKKLYIIILNKVSKALTNYCFCPILLLFDYIWLKLSTNRANCSQLMIVECIVRFVKFGRISK
jgi:hypothetical protein